MLACTALAGSLSVDDLLYPGKVPTVTPTGPKVVRLDDLRIAERLDPNSVKLTIGVMLDRGSLIKERAQLQEQITLLQQRASDIDKILSVFD